MRRVVALVIGLAMSRGCVSPDDVTNPPRLVEADAVALTDVLKISRFRSGIGHDFSMDDSGEDCRSMKHYYVPLPGVRPAVASPVAGRIQRILDEGDLDGDITNANIWIAPHSHPAFLIGLYHVDISSSGVRPGQEVAPGTLLGTLTAGDHWVDIAVEVQTVAGRRFISFSELMTDELFESYKARGVASRNALAIGKEERDAAPLECNGDEEARFQTEEQIDGEQSTSNGIENWVMLR